MAADTREPTDAAAPASAQKAARPPPCPKTLAYFAPTPFLSSFHPMAGEADEQVAARSAGAERESGAAELRSPELRAENAGA